jgi:hypothetical protein
MNLRAIVRVGGVMLMSLASVVGVQGVGAAPAMASSRVVHATGTGCCAELDFDSIQLFPQGQNCLFTADTHGGRLSGTLEGTVELVEPEQLLFFDTCEELVADPFKPRADLYRAVSHYVGNDGKQATLRDFGRTDETGFYRGIAVVSGDLNGVLHVSGPGFGPVTYDGILVVKD